MSYMDEIRESYSLRLKIPRYDVIYTGDLRSPDWMIVSVILGLVRRRGLRNRWKGMYRVSVVGPKE